MNYYNDIRTSAIVAEAEHESAITNMGAQIDALQADLATVTNERDSARLLCAGFEDALDEMGAYIDELEARIRELTPVNPAQDLVAVRVFPTYTDKVYGNTAAVLAKIGELGVKRISHLLTPGMSVAVQKFTTDAYALGVKSWLTVGAPREPLTAAQWTKVEALLTGPLAGAVDMVSGWNEPNNARTGTLPSNWHTLTIAHQKALWACILRVNAALDANGHDPIKVGTPQLWSGNIDQQYTDLGKIAPGIQGAYDVIAWHLYMRPANGVVGWAMCEDQETHFRAALGDFPIVCTESGMFTAPNYSGGSYPVTEAQQAELLPELIDWYVSRGYGIGLFELLDDPDQTGTLRESSFGLVRCPSLNPDDWTDKPALATIRDHIA